MNISVLRPVRRFAAAAARDARITAASLMIVLALVAASGHVTLRAQAGAPAFPPAQAVAPVFLPAGSAAAARPFSGITVRWRLAHIDFAVLAAARDGSASGQAAPALLLNLFPDASFLFRVDSREPTFSGGHALRGRLDGVEMGTATLVVNGSVFSGAVRTPEATYRIGTVGEDLHVIEEVDLSLLPDGAEPITPVRSPEAEADASESTDDVDVQESDEGPFMDIAVFYTQGARARYGGQSATEAIIDRWIAETNGFYENTQIPARLRLVARQEIDYDESSSMYTDLDRLKSSSDSHMTEVHPVRRATGADLVHLIVDHGPRSYVCGIGYHMHIIGVWFKSWAYSATNYKCGALTFAHELGHNMGLNHDRHVLSDNARRDGAEPWAYGYVNQRAFDDDASSRSLWRTIMSYGWQCSEQRFNCTKLGFFSSPDLTYRGHPLGVAGDERSTALDGPADAQRTLERTGKVVSKFRSSVQVDPEDPVEPVAPVVDPCSYTLTPTRRYVLPRGGGPFEFAVTASTSSCSWSPSTDDDFLRLHTGARTGNGVVRYSVHPHAGLGARTGVIRVSDDAAFTVTTGPARLLAPASGGVVSGGVVSIAVTADADLADLRRWDFAVDGMARSDTLRLQARHADPGAPGRTHETFVQHHHGVPVHGAGVNRELDRGLAVSVAGVVHESITVGTDPALSAAEAAGRFEAATGSRLASGRAPALTVLPLADGSYALTWKMTHGDGETAFVDAHDGRVISGAP